MQKYGQKDKQEEIKELERKQAALLKDIPEAQLQVRKIEEENE